MFKALLVAAAMLIAIVFAGATSAAADTGQQPTSQATLSCPSDMHWSFC
jgi:hypothetical protein